VALTSRWDPCISHAGEGVHDFIAAYFDDSRTVLLVAGIGFDPRTTRVARELTSSRAITRAILLRENRPGPPNELVELAEANRRELLELVPGAAEVEIQVLDSDGAVLGGRRAASAIKSSDISDVTDVVVDLSAMSVGCSFPVVRFLMTEVLRRTPIVNLHVLVAHDPALDAAIRPISGDRPGYVHSFNGGVSLHDSSVAARLWLPQLRSGGNVALGRIHAFVNPHDTCPILPFPSIDPRLGDTLAEEYMQELESAWQVDSRNLVYADEGDPLDLYRTILQLDDLRKPVFECVGGSRVILSPTGSKVMALGALMAALERDLPVAYLEADGYEFDPSMPHPLEQSSLVHVWLEGDAYPLPRPPFT
jgi:hypothetical protein